MNADDELLGELSPQSDPEGPEDIPPEFNWNVAWDQMGRAGADRAMIIGLSMISEQLGYIARRMTNDG